MTVKSRAKLLIVADHKSPHTRRWANYMVKLGHPVAVFSLNDPPSSDMAGGEYLHDVQLFLMNRSRSRMVNMIVGAIRYIYASLTWMPEVINAHSTGSYSWLTFFNKKSKVAITPWGKDLLVDLRPSAIEYLLTRWSLRRCARVLTDGKNVVNVLTKLKIKDTKIFFFNWGVDIERLKQKTHYPLKARSEETIVASTRTPTEVHELDVLIDAVAEISEKTKRIRFVIAGSGNQLSFLKKKADERNISSIIDFPGMQSEHEISTLLHRADIYVSTSPVDSGLSISTAEAMASALPVIHVNNEDNNLWVPPQKGGYSFNRGDYMELARIIQELAASREKQAEFGVFNRRTIEESFTTARAMEAISQIYQQIAAMPK
jgi:glycosyltransferase involved in cell wall biosynthesis